jgi:hypothetical protein
MPRLVLRPAIEFGISEHLRCALLLLGSRRPQGTLLVIGGQRGEVRRLIPVTMAGQGRREALTDVPLVGRITEAKPSQGNHAFREGKNASDGREMVPEHTNRTTAEPNLLCGQDEGLHQESGVYGGVEKGFQVLVRQWVAA